MLQILNLLGKETALWAYIWILFTSPVTFWESMSKCIKQLLACYKIIISIIVASGCNYVFIAEAFHVWKLELILFRRQGLWAKLWPPSSWIIALSWRKGCVTQRRWAMLCRATQDGCVIVESSDKTWSTGEGNEWQTTSVFLPWEPHEHYNHKGFDLCHTWIVQWFSLLSSI